MSAPRILRAILTLTAIATAPAFAQGQRPMTVVDVLNLPEEVDREFLYQVPVLRELPRRRELTELFALVLRLPFMSRSLVETGAEYEVYFQLRQPPPPGANPDFKALTSTVQMTNLTEYQGYRLTTTLGFTVTRLAVQYEPAEIRTKGFITIYAGIERE